jgi:hypothetical protein
MKNILLLQLLFGTAAFAANVVITAVDGGGGRATSANYVNDGSIGAITGVSTAGVGIARHGYVGQLTEVSSMTATGAPATVNETATTQLSGAATMDDATVTVLTGSEINWIAPTWPLAAINASGVASAAVVYANTSATVTGAYLGVTGSGALVVLNSNPDNFGLYDSDQIPDGWQVAYFGTENPAGQASATNATGQNNLYAYVADLCPTNPNASFAITAVSNTTLTNSVCFWSSSNRLYLLEWTTNLIAGGWTNTPGVTPVAGNGGMFWRNDTNATSPRFYRVSVRVP